MLRDRGPAAAAPRPAACPFCRGKAVDTLAKTFTEHTFWSCRACARTWTIAGLKASAARPR